MAFSTLYGPIDAAYVDIASPFPKHDPASLPQVQVEVRRNTQKLEDNLGTPRNENGRFSGNQPLASY